MIVGLQLFEPQSDGAGQAGSRVAGRQRGHPREQRPLFQLLYRVLTPVHKEIGVHFRLASGLSLPFLPAAVVLKVASMGPPLFLLFFIFSDRLWCDKKSGSKKVIIYEQYVAEMAGIDSGLGW